MPVPHLTWGYLMSRLSRVIVIAAALLLVATYYFPLWQIELEAPQYPEGLGLSIYTSTITGQHPGDLAKINNLNHYIGMQSIHPESIPELKIMPWVMRFMLLFGIVAGFVGKRILLLIWLLLFVVVAVVGFYDYYQWGYDYGHNLDMENAIIKIPGMSYQPPLIGSKKLLNFNAISLPGIGGWLATLSFWTCAAVWYLERRAFKRRRNR